jgi:dihydroorotate dehydrogenase electron transfer subunit
MPKVKIKLKDCKILENRQIAPDFFKMKVLAPEIARTAYAGQFVNVRASEKLNPLLRRPLGFHRIGKKDFDLLYKVVGPGTRLLSGKNKGDYLDILGPLGNGFSGNIDDGRENPLIIAGGVGVAPMLALAEKLKKQKPVVLLGATRKKEVVCKKDFQKLGCRVKVSTDDGSMGFKGYVTELLNKVLRNTCLPCPSGRRAAGRRNTTIFACGPRCRKRRIPAYGSLHEFMACGMGSCLSCVVRVHGQKQGKRVCVDGPVFDLNEVIF